MKTKTPKPSESKDLKIGKSLEQYKGKVIFKEKLKKGNETLKRVGLPDFKPAV